MVSFYDILYNIILVPQSNYEAVPSACYSHHVQGPRLISDLET